jgi:hypothetical protein
MAIWVKADGTAKPVEPANGREFTLEEMQEYVGGYIELVTVNDLNGGRMVIVLNEEGKLDGLPYNLLATLVYGNPMDVIVGDVLFCNFAEVGE